jgi:hypothetical protein
MRVILAELTGLRRLGRPSPSHQRPVGRGWRAQDPVGGGWVFPRDQCHPLLFLSQRLVCLSIHPCICWPSPSLTLVSLANCSSVGALAFSRIPKTFPSSTGERRCWES